MRAGLVAWVLHWLKMSRLLKIQHFMAFSASSTILSPDGEFFLQIQPCLQLPESVPIS